MRMVQLHRNRDIQNFNGADVQTVATSPAFGTGRVSTLRKMDNAAASAAVEDEAIVEELDGVVACSAEETDCCVCFEHVATERMREAFTCNVNHWVCRSCRPQVRMCPLCRQGR